MKPPFACSVLLLQLMYNLFMGGCVGIAHDVDSHDKHMIELGEKFLWPVQGHSALPPQWSAISSTLEKVHGLTICISACLAVETRHAASTTTPVQPLLVIRLAKAHTGPYL
jgi:hypothetical protein